MSIEQIINALGLSAVLLYFFIPLIVVCLSVYSIRAIKRNAKIKVKQAKAKKDRQANIEEKSNNNTAYKTESIAIEFDENGEIKR